jgi:hypothetical protein
MKHCFLTKKNTVEAKAWLDKHYTNSAPAKLTVEKWFAKFKRFKMSIEEDTYENIKKVHKIILNDRKVKLIEIAKTQRYQRNVLNILCMNICSQSIKINNVLIIRSNV